MTMLHESPVNWACRHIWKRFDQNRDRRDHMRRAIAAFLRNVEATPQMLTEMGKCETDQERFAVVCGALANELERGVQ